MDKLYNFKEHTLLLNESIVGDIWQKVLNFFRKKYKQHTWQYLLHYLKKKNELPKGVEFFPYSQLSTSNISENKNSSFHYVGFKHLNEEAATYVDLNHSDKQITNLDTNKVIRSIKQAYNYRLKTGKQSALFIWGAPGIGKTDIVTDVAKELKLDIIVFHLAQIDPTEFRGIPKIENIMGDNNPSSERTVNKLPAIFPTSNGSHNNGGIIFLDELNRAPKPVLAAALPLCLEGKIGDYKIPDKWVIVAAGNRKEDIGFDATEIEPALANRFRHINYTPTVQGWSEWANTKKYIDPKLVAFLNFKREMFHQLATDDPSMAWPSPRSWSVASENVYTIDENFDIDLEYMQEIYAGEVGIAAAVEFIAYLELVKLFSERDIMDVYEKGDKAKQPPARLDQANAVVSSIAFYKKGVEITPVELENMFKYALSMKNFETSTSLLAYLRIAHTKNGRCFYKDKKPWSDIYHKYIEKWSKAETQL